jgi:predicted MFS family arabinose efflux permease
LVSSVVIEPPKRAGYGSALVSREFRALFLGQLVSTTGTSVAAVALTVLVYRRTGSPFLSGLTFSLGFLPYVVGVGVSALVDRVRPRRLVASCDALAAVLAAVMAWPGAPVPLLLVLMFCLGLLSSVASGSRGALVRSTVSYEAYVPARSLLRLASQGAQLGGNAFGGLLLVALSPSGAILVNAASFLFSASIVRLVVQDHPNAGETSGADLLRDSLRGARAILARAELRRLLLLGWLVPMFSVVPEALAAPYVARHHGSAALVGIWLVALPVGVIAGDVFGVRFLGGDTQRRIVWPIAAAGFVPYLAFALRPGIPLALALLVASGVTSMYGLGLDARVRDAAPEQLFARTMALNTAGLMTLQGLGFALGGALAQGVGPAYAIALAGVAGVAATIATRPRRPAR